MRKRTICILPFILLFAIILAGCPAPDNFPLENNSIANNTWPQTNTGGIHGTITDVNKAPLENASVVLIGSPASSGLTDANGKYNISKVPAGSYVITASKPGYRNVTIVFNILGGRSYSWNATLSSSASSFHGTITNLLNLTLENATVSIVGAQNYSGMTDETGGYNVTGIQPGTYDIFVQKPGYKNVTLSNFTIVGGSYPWNVTIAKNCIYYSVNASSNYVLRYGFAGTIYQGEMEFTVAYPPGATYDAYPTTSGLSSLNTAYQAGNRMLKWKLDNSEASYSSVGGHIYMNMNGTGTMQVYNPKEMGISAAASAKSGYLGSETTADGKTLIDPYNSEIWKIARQVKNEAGSNDTWTVARALFVWLKNNTVYYIDPQTSNYSHLPTETLHSGKGKCDELAHLYLSLLRADGIPARFVKGYLIEKNPDRYLSHVWVEFYDGEWVPVEVAGGSTNASAEADTNFGILGPDHVAVFIDDGTDDSINEGDASTGLYYDWPAVFPFSIYYDAVGYNQTYISVCSDGTRELKKEME